MTYTLVDRETGRIITRPTERMVFGPLDAGWLAQVPGGTPHEWRNRITDEGVSPANTPA
ncbi:MAG TPA: hypothetical protein VGP82_01540 [Ktedonobacterales bacterium]|nr:hypothetical protein [Ktedonobacterales bacterium]